MALNFSTHVSKTGMLKPFLLKVTSITFNFKRISILNHVSENLGPDNFRDDFLKIREITTDFIFFENQQSFYIIGLQVKFSESMSQISNSVEK